jgi:drug/metabolite transporter (DMT)-like permease
MDNERVMTIVIVTLAVTALLFAVLGFAQAPNSQVSPATVSTFMLISAGLFGVLGVLALRRPKTWLRFLGVAAITGAIYMAVMAFLYFQALRLIQMTV